MLIDFPTQVFPRGVRRLLYTSKSYVEGLEIKMVLFTPRLIEKAPLVFKELGYGVYYLDHSFNILGEWVGLFFENDVRTGQAIFRISLEG